MNTFCCLRAEQVQQSCAYHMQTWHEKVLTTRTAKEELTSGHDYSASKKTSQVRPFSTNHPSCTRPGLSETECRAACMVSIAAAEAKDIHRGSEQAVQHCFAHAQ